MVKHNSYLVPCSGSIVPVPKGRIPMPPGDYAICAAPLLYCYTNKQNQFLEDRFQLTLLQL